MHRAVRIWLAVGVAVTLVFAASPAHAAPKKKPVTMAFSVSPASVKSGSMVQLAGRAWSGRKGNAGRVDLYFLKRGAKAWAFAGSTRAAGNGSFRRTVRASATGTFRAVYRGNAKRRAAIRYDHLAVFATRTVTKLRHSATGIRPNWPDQPECTPGADFFACMHESRDVSVTSAPLRVSVVVDARHPEIGLLICYADTNWPGSGPADYERRSDCTALSARSESWDWTYSEDLTITPRRTTGRFYVKATGGDHTWHLKVTQDVTETVRV